MDCGTNSTRLLVFDPLRGTLAREMRITRLGEGVDATGRLDRQAISRTVAVLEAYRISMDQLGVSRGRLVATSAVRDALNAGEFIEAARDATGLVPEVLTGAEEGTLSFLGATRSLPPRQAISLADDDSGDQARGPVEASPGQEPAGPAMELVVDIGGGSTELVVGVPGGSGAAPGGTVLAAVSMDVGCVRIAERYLRHDPPLSTELAAARSAIARELSAAFERVPDLAEPARRDPGGRMIGLAGTVSTLASIAQRLDGYDRRRIHHYLLGASQVSSWTERLAAMDSTGRLAQPGMVKGREDVIVGGLLVLESVMDAFGRSSCLVSEDDILDGLAASLL